MTVLPKEFRSSTTLGRQGFVLCLFFLYQEVDTIADVRDKRRLLQEIDKDFDIDFNPHTESYVITHRGYYFQVVPYGEFTRETLDHIREVVYINRNGDIFKEVDEANEKVELAKEKADEQFAEDVAKEIGKPLYKALTE